MYAEEVIIFNFKGKYQIIQIKDIERIDSNPLKEIYPIKIKGVNMILERDGFIQNREIFEAILNGYLIELPRQNPIIEKIMSITKYFQK